MCQRQRLSFRVISASADSLFYVRTALNWQRTSRGPSAAACRPSTNHSGLTCQLLCTVNIFSLHLPLPSLPILLTSSGRTTMTYAKLPLNRLQQCVANSTDGVHQNDVYIQRILNSFGSCCALNAPVSLKNLSASTSK